eukprot:scaffold149_cov315-Pinguiococcus_pyrenoidosus.AAC.102
MPALQPLDDPRTQEHLRQYYHKRVQSVLAPIVESMLAQGVTAPEEFLVSFLGAKDPRLAKAADRIKQKKILMQQRQAKTQALRQAIDTTKRQIREALLRQEDRQQRRMEEEERRKQFVMLQESAECSRLAKDRLVQKDPVAALAGCVSVHATQLRFSSRYGVVAENLFERRSHVSVAKESTSFSSRYGVKQVMGSTPARALKTTAKRERPTDFSLFEHVKRILESQDAADLADAVAEIVLKRRPDLRAAVDGLMRTKLALAEKKAAILRIQAGFQEAQSDIDTALEKRRERRKRVEEARQQQRGELKMIAEKRPELRSQIARLLDRDAAVARKAAETEALKMQTLRAKASLVSALQRQAERVAKQDEVAALYAAYLGGLADREERLRVLRAVRETRPDLIARIDAVEARDAEVEAMAAATSQLQAQLDNAQMRLHRAQLRQQQRQKVAPDPTAATSAKVSEAELAEQLRAIAAQRPELSQKIEEIFAREQKLLSMKEQTKGITEELRKTTGMLENATERRQRRAPVAGGASSGDAKNQPLDPSKIQALQEIAKKRPELADKVKFVLQRDDLLMKKKAENAELSQSVNDMNAKLSGAIKRRALRLNESGQETEPQDPSGAGAFAEIATKRPDLGAKVAQLSERDTKLSLQRRKTEELQLQLDKVLQMQRSADERRELRLAQRQVAAA